MDRLRIGLVGFGRFGKIHSAAIAATNAAEVSSVCVGTEKTAAEARLALGTDAVFTDYEEFLSKGRMDVVDIVSPNFLHAQHAINAIGRGKDVFLEKPMAVSLEEARKILEANRRTPTKVHVGFNYRYAPLWAETKSALESGAVAEPSFAKVEEWRSPFRTGSGGWRFDGTRVGHQLFEQTIHHFDIAAWYFGMPERVHAFTDTPESFKRGIFKTAVATLEYPNGLRVLVANTVNGFSTNVSVSVSGNGALIGAIQTGDEWETTTSWLKVRDTAGALHLTKLKIPGEVETMTTEMLDFVVRVREGREPAVTLEDGFKALSLTLTTIEAVESGRAERPPVS